MLAYAFIKILLSLFNKQLRNCFLFIFSVFKEYIKLSFKIFIFLHFFRNICSEVWFINKQFIKSYASELFPHISKIVETYQWLVCIKKRFRKMKYLLLFCIWKQFVCKKFEEKQFLNSKWKFFFSFFHF